jgi:hypothetical protein
VDGADELAVVGLARRLVGRAHEALEVMRGLGECDLEPVAAGPHTVAAVGESPGPVARDMGERAHHDRGGRAAHPARDRHEREIADRIADARVQLRLRRDEQFPVGRIGDVLEDVDRRIDRADDPVRDRPADAAQPHTGPPKV